MEKVLEFLSGKKGIIATILMGVVAYLASLGIIGEAEIALATIIISALFGTASYYTGRLVYGKR